MDKHEKAGPTASGRDSHGSDILLLKDRALDVAAEGITIADMRLPDQPLIYINEGFERLTGYSASSMLGHNCRFLQGEGTETETVDEIRNALRSGKECTVEILNYKKSGEPFWNRLSLTPVSDASGEVTHFIGVQSDITKRKNAESALRDANEQLKNANRSMKRDLEAAAAIQRSLLPDSAPMSERIKFSWLYQPCDELGGDTLNVFRIDRDRFAVYMVDVSGHGVRASLLSVTLSHWFTRHFQAVSNPIGERDPAAIESLYPVKVAEELNLQFQMDAENAQYFTMCYGIVDVSSREFRFVTAANPPLIVARKDGSVDILKVEGFPVGMFSEPGYTENVVGLDSGDRVFLYTDGVTEAEGEGEAGFGTERLATNVANLSGLDLDGSVGTILENVRGWTGPRSLEDDVSILAFELA
ncbi:MAG: SpoIIE family protein phosphatase [Acidobacteriota bacterium]|nr:MAG: SpoIIE family protein phosphatase [Acidobacteriota bacterium]